MQNEGTAAIEENNHRCFVVVAMGDGRIERVITGSTWVPIKASHWDFCK